LLRICRSALWRADRAALRTIDQRLEAGEAGAVAAADLRLALPAAGRLRGGTPLAMVNLVEALSQAVLPGERRRCGKEATVLSGAPRARTRQDEGRGKQGDLTVAWRSA
jgi:hypothetical protein